jgi:hypothetical protein
MDRVSFYFLWTLSSFSTKVHKEGSSYPYYGSFWCQIVRCNVGVTDAAGASEPLFLDCLIPQEERSPISCGITANGADYGNGYVGPKGVERASVLTLVALRKSWRGNTG